MDIQSSLPSPGPEEHLARLEAEEQANECLYKVLDIGQAMLQSGGGGLIGHLLAAFPDQLIKCRHGFPPFSMFAPGDTGRYLF